MVKVVGVSASLRNARFGKGSLRLCEEIRELASEQDLFDYLQRQTKLRADDFISAGRDQGLEFDEIYSRLQKLRGEQGLSNSEAALAAALWGAVKEGAEIEHLPLASYFPANGRNRKTDELKQHILSLDALIISGPVYFGDRGSLAQAFIEFITADEEIRNHISGKVYGGVAVGAKRNGGQETTLIYQLVDLVNLNMLGVGNDSETTAQYGGTAVAGDVGTLASDKYGVKTAIGTGARVARVAQCLKQAESHELTKPLRVDVWLLQESADKRGTTYMEAWAREVEKRDGNVKIVVRDLTESEVYRCIACDVCPISFGDREDYRCIVKAKNDLFVSEHKNFLEPDAVLLAAYSPRDRHDIKSVYQTFIERTRYWRRDNYILGDRLWAPFVVSEMSARQNLHIRMLTSAIRHHTVLHHPIIGMELDGKLLNESETIRQGLSFVAEARRLTVGHLVEERNADIIYNPLGYSWSKEKVERARESGELEHYVRRNKQKKLVRDRVSKIV